MKERKVIQQVQGFRTSDGAGVSLVRVLGRETANEFDPFLMLDSVLEIGEGEIVARKRVRPDEPCFAGHFPGDPIFPGVLQIEAMAQAMAALMTLSNPEFRGRRPLFLGVDGCRFRRPVRPGDDLRVHAKILKISRGVGICRTEIRMDGNLVSEATLKASLAP